MRYIPSGRVNGKSSPREDMVYLSSQLILGIINEYFGTTNEILIAKSRKREIVWPRQVAMYFMSYYTVMPLKGIGVIFGGKDHTTVIHAVQVVNDLQQSDSLVKEQIFELTQKFDNYVKVGRENKGRGEGQHLGHA